MVEGGGSKELMGWGGKVSGTGMVWFLEKGVLTIKMK